jgi:hypothetical protein
MNQAECYWLRKCCICGSKIEKSDLPELVNGFPVDPVVCEDPECQHIAFSGSIYFYAVEKIYDKDQKKWVHLIREIDDYTGSEETK